MVVKALNAEHMQGFLFSKPVPNEDFEALLLNYIEYLIQV